MYRQTIVETLCCINAHFGDHIRIPQRLKNVYSTVYTDLCTIPKSNLCKAVLEDRLRFCSAVAQKFSTLLTRHIPRNKLVLTDYSQRVREKTDI